MRNTTAYKMWVKSTSTKVRLNGYQYARARYMTKLYGPGWMEFELSTCRFGCKVCVKSRGAVIEARLFHSAIYGCPKGAL